MYNKTLLGLFFFFLSINGLCAQDLVVAPALVQFSATEQGNCDTQRVYIYNQGLVTRQVEDVKLLRFYDDTVFRSLQSFPLAILPRDSVGVDLVFKPEHNLINKGVAVFTSSNGPSPVQITLSGQGLYSALYSSTMNLEGEPLRKELAAIASRGHFSLGYNGARDRMFMTIDNKRTNGQGATQNTLECPYTGRVITGYANRSAAQNSPHNFNTEHTFPQSLFPTNDTMKSDLHHLYATDANSNSQRGNLPFGTLTNWTWSQGGSKRGANAFEPRDVHKGQAARSVLYFGIRYLNNSGVSRTFIAGQEATLRDWHDKYPPTVQEIKRNNDIANAQGNRNPLIDYPQFLSRMSQIANTAKDPKWKGPVLIENNVNLGAINAGSKLTYEYVFCNEGTDSITLTNISVNDPTAMLSNLPGGIAGGECEVIKIVITGDGNNHSFELKYDVDFLGTSSYTISFDYSGNVGVNNLNANLEYLIIQNPASLQIKFFEKDLDANKRVRLIDLSGRVIRKIEVKPGTQFEEINTSGLSQNIYNLELTAFSKNGLKKSTKRVFLSQ